MGCRQVGKAPDFDSGMRWFESSHPSTTATGRLSRGGSSFFCETTTMTTRERVAAAVAAMQAADAPAACAHFAHDARYVEAKRETLVGRAAIEAHFARFFHHVPSFRFVVDAVVVEEARAVVLYKFGVTRRVGSAGSDFLQTERDGCAFVVVRNDGIALWKEYEG